MGDLLPVCFANSSPHQRLWFRSPQDENYLNYPFLEELEPGLIFPARVVGTRNASIFFQIFPGFNAISPARMAGRRQRVTRSYSRSAAYPGIRPILRPGADPCAP